MTPADVSHLKSYVANMYCGALRSYGFQDDDFKRFPIVNSPPNRTIAFCELRIERDFSLEELGSPRRWAISDKALRQRACASAGAR